MPAVPAGVAAGCSPLARARPAPRAAAAPAPSAAALPRSRRVARGSARQAVAGAQRPGPGGRIARGAAVPALNPWGPGAGDACGAAGGGHARPWAAPPRAGGRSSGTPHARRPGGTRATRDPAKHFPQCLGASPARPAPRLWSRGHWAPYFWLRPHATSAHPRGWATWILRKRGEGAVHFPRQPMEYLSVLFPPTCSPQKLGSCLPSWPVCARKCERAVAEEVTAKAIPQPRRAAVCTETPPPAARSAPGAATRRSRGAAATAHLAPLRQEPGLPRQAPPERQPATPCNLSRRWRILNATSLS